MWAGREGETIPVGTVLYKEELDGIPGSLRRGRQCCSQYEATLEAEAGGRRGGGRRPSDEEDVEDPPDGSPGSPEQNRASSQVDPGIPF